MALRYRRFYPTICELAARSQLPRERLRQLLSTRAARGTVLVLTDNQILDGRWFQDLAQDGERWNEFAALVDSGKIILRRRAVSWRQQLDLYVRGKPFEFSSMPGGAALSRWMKEFIGRGGVIDGWSELAFQSVPENLSGAFAEMRARIEHLADRLAARGECTGQLPLDQATSFEDPGGFVHQLESGEGRDLAVEVFQFGNRRSEAFARLKQFDESKSNEQ